MIHNFKFYRMYSVVSYIKYTFYGKNTDFTNVDEKQCNDDERSLKEMLSEVNVVVECLSKRARLTHLN